MIVHLKKMHELCKAASPEDVRMLQEQKQLAQDKYTQPGQDRAGREAGLQEYFAQRQSLRELGHDMPTGEWTSNKNQQAQAPAPAIAAPSKEVRPEAIAAATAKYGIENGPKGPMATKVPMIHDGAGGQRPQDTGDIVDAMANAGSVKHESIRSTPDAPPEAVKKPKFPLVGQTRKSVDSLGQAKSSMERLGKAIAEKKAAAVGYK